MKKGKDFEADYFLKEEQLKKQKQALLNKNERENKENLELKNLHFMKCSKCGHDLVKKRMSYIEIDQCLDCGAIVIAKEDIEGFITEERSVLKALIDFFK